MKWLIGLFAACLLSVSSAFALPPVPGVLAAADMEAPPATAVAVTQCNLLVAAYFTLKDGRFVKSDVKDHPTDVSADDVLRWGDTATTGAHRVEVNCDDPARAIQRTANKPDAPVEQPKSDTQFVILDVCSEPVAVVVGSSKSLIVRTHDEMPAISWKRVIRDLKEVERQNGPVHEVELQGACAST
jgi:hypothetical protein